jgi:uncharacterized protein
MTSSATISTTEKPTATIGNPLFPVFLKLEQLRLLIVGGGNVATEKLDAVLQNAPATNITIVATQFNDLILQLAAIHDTITLIERSYLSSDLNNADLVIAAVNDPSTSTQISSDARAAGKLVNVADKPSLCDFYLGSIVQKGQVKIAISTNGKSPTTAKRLKEVLNEALPAELDLLVENLAKIRQSLQGDFAFKVNRLNEITQSLISARSIHNGSAFRHYKKVAAYVLLAICCMIIGHVLFTYTPMKTVWIGLSKLV